MKHQALQQECFCPWSIYLMTYFFYRTSPSLAKRGARPSTDFMTIYLFIKQRMSMAFLGDTCLGYILCNAILQVTINISYSTRYKETFDSVAECNLEF